MPTEGVEPYQRRDTQHVDQSQRPRKAEYDRYLWLVQHFRGLGWDNAKLHDASPFRVVDPGFNAILIRSDGDLADLADALGEPALAGEARGRATQARAAFATLWSDRLGQFVCYDRAAGHQVDSASVGGILPVFAALGSEEQQRALAGVVERWRRLTRFGIASHAPDDPRFEAKRYWRGPAWIIVNTMIADGLARCGLMEASEQVNRGSLDLIEARGFAEYYDPLTGEGLGGGEFTWTAAMIADLVSRGGAALLTPAEDR